jgi:hypothetical protein
MMTTTASGTGLARTQCVGDVPVGTRVSDMDDLELERHVRAAFGRYRRMRNQGAFHPDAAYIDHLVELQREYLRRFPAGDLSVGTVPHL